MPVASTHRHSVRGGRLINVHPAAARQFVQRLNAPEFKNFNIREHDERI
jgi:hypothetical protein